MRLAVPLSSAAVVPAVPAALSLLVVRAAVMALVRAQAAWHGWTGRRHGHFGRHWNRRLWSRLRRLGRVRRFWRECGPRPGFG